MATRNRSRRQGSGGGLGTGTALVFWDTGNCHILRMQRESNICESVCEAGVDLAAHHELVNAGEREIV